MSVLLALDAVDRGLVHALSLDGRASFSRIGEVLGVSTQTVTRRYRRLHAAAGLRVLGLPDPELSGGAQWMVRLTTSPAAAVTLARSLARRSDTAWVKLTSGGTEIFAIVRAQEGDPRSTSLLLHDIPRRASITAVSAHLMLHTYLGGPTSWRGTTTTLDESQQRRLRDGVPEGLDARPLSAADRALLEVLGRDGRASHAELASATGWSPATVGRRVHELRASGAVFFDVEISPAHFGIDTQALLWMSIPPAALDRVATGLAGHEELAVVAATTGPTNLVAQALCSDPADLHRYLTTKLGSIPAIDRIETAPVLHTVKGIAPLAS
ncbi:MAG TPA: AsnC family transcriptional regulator [Stackebrandtia sp.]|uniref:Lrp/AsnC family transcriptional regulator n=1 Tax=Stackebrandtia sp. TaxID=2023065 RepID=UPI002D3AB711|nr:AsnC family transcriptional regulator [Stackebrandtia sp.]HZE40996.1 AsnC family transcriptional regulator [Stackebrandtia sp.]